MLENLIKDCLALVDNGIEVKDLPLHLKPQGFFSYMMYGFIKAKLTVTKSQSFIYITINVDCKPYLPLTLKTEKYGNFNLSRLKKNPELEFGRQIISSASSFVVENEYVNRYVSFSISRDGREEIIIPSVYSNCVLGIPPAGTYYLIKTENCELDY